MKNFNWDEFKNDKVAIHCDTLEKAKDFIDRCITHGFTWRDGDKLDVNDTCWMDCRCYMSKNKGLVFDSIHNINSYKGKILEWELESSKGIDLTIEQKVESLENQIKELKEELHKAQEEKGETTTIYEITYIQDGRSYITGMLVKDIETARKFKHEYEKLNHISNVNIVKITETKEVVE